MVFNKTWIYATFLVLFSQSSLGFADPLMMPENCLQNQKTPCLVKFKKNDQLDYKNLTLNAVQETVIKITDFKAMTIDLSQGRMIINFNKSAALLQVSDLVFTKGPMYIEKQGHKTVIISGENYKRIELNQVQKKETVKTSVMDKIAFVTHLSKYYSNKQHFRIALQQIFPIYLSTYKTDVENQRQQLQRSIASVEYREEQERLKQAEIKAQQQNNRDLFFQRTFKQ